MDTPCTRALYDEWFNGRVCYWCEETLGSGAETDRLHDTLDFCSSACFAVWISAKWREGGRWLDNPACIV